MGAPPEPAASTAGAGFLIRLVSDIGLRVLASGSSGNAALAAAGSTVLLLEAGLSRRGLEARIEAAGRTPEEIAAVLLSHEHGDHCRGAAPFALRHRLPIACTRGTWNGLALRDRSEAPEWIPLQPGQPRQIGTMAVTGFSIPHDAREPIGFRLDTGEATLVHVTDFGHLSPEVAEAVSGASVLLIESNYDEQQLYESRYPFSTRQRIASTRGHLSNGALALYLRRRLPASVHTVLLAHLSANTNTPELALRTARTALDAARRPDVRLLVANRSALTEEVRTGTGEPSPLPHPNPLATGTRSLFHPA